MLEYNAQVIEQIDTRSQLKRTYDEYQECHQVVNEVEDEPEIVMGPPSKRVKTDLV